MDEGWDDEFEAAEWPSDLDVVVPVPTHLTARDAAWCPDDDAAGFDEDWLDTDTPTGDDDHAVLRELATAVDREPWLVVPDHSPGHSVVRDEQGHPVSTVAGIAPGADLARMLEHLTTTVTTGTTSGTDTAGGLAGLGDPELGEVVAACQRLASWARGTQAAAITELTRRPAMQPLSSGASFASVSAQASTALEITDPLTLTSGQAQNLVAESVELTKHFPATHAALSAGVIDERRARAIQTMLRTHEPDIASLVEATVLAQAASLNTTQLRRKIRLLLLKLAPATSEERHARAREDRHVRFNPGEDGMVWIDGLLPAEDAAALKAVLDAGQLSLKRRDAATGDAAARTADQRRADTLAYLAWTALTAGRTGAPPPPGTSDTTPDDTADDMADAADAGTSHAHGADDLTAAKPAGAGPDEPTKGSTAESATDTTAANDLAAGDAAAAPPPSGPPVGSPFGNPTSPGEPAAGGCTACGGGGLRLAGAHGRPVTVNVTIPLSTLLGLDEHPGHLDGYGPIPAHIARHLSTAGLWRWVGTDDITGAVLSHGRTRYKPTQDLIDHVILRDRTCRAPGCAARAEVCELDHSIYWPLGPTAACNLGLFCKKHHLAKHHTRWRIEQPQPGVFHWISPTGRIITTHQTVVGPEPPPEPPETGPPDPADDIPPF